MLELNIDGSLRGNVGMLDLASDGSVSSTITPTTDHHLAFGACPNEKSQTIELSNFPK